MVEPPHTDWSGSVSLGSPAQSAALARYETRSADVVDLVSKRLASCYRRHSVSRSSVRAAQTQARRARKHRGSTRDHRQGDSTAQPLAQRFVAEATATIDEEAAQLRSLSQHLLDDLQRSGRLGHDLHHHAVDAIEGAVDRFCSAMPPPVTLNDLGSWWQRRLRRAATLRSLPKAPLGQNHLLQRLIYQEEMKLLERADWAAGDQCLASFEIAYSDVASHLRWRASLLVDSLKAPVSRQAAPTALQPS